MERESLERELERFKQEKEQIRQIVGMIGGFEDTKKDKAINITFFVLIAALLLFDITRHIFGIEIPLPPMISIEIGVMLVSLKIIWMMHKQTKLEHFMFWILNSLEFRLNDIQKRIISLDKKKSAGK